MVIFVRIYVLLFCLVDWCEVSIGVGVCVGHQLCYHCCNCQNHVHCNLDFYCHSMTWWWCSFGIGVGDGEVTRVRVGVYF